ncbi:F-box/kelch-repeat protein At1g80440-like [Gastrolobium bilobum]|uniref:F-box/kelch-repeat protein At1g80440-like n=1 Tax=Gastrolobium bilobum TaxID=150636 RepID=UPI002AAF7873|nr:F-box/kelch-repeat protein At1g80440-like [Gastrolobium bilobum]
MELISGLPEDVARDCLIRVSYQQFSTVASVCKGWKTEVQMPEFRRQRRSTGHSQKVLVMVQARVEPEKSGTGSTKRLTNPAYRLSVFEPETGDWSELPPPPGFGSGLPVLCQLADVGYDLVVMGGLDPDSWKASNSVFIYNFLSAKWRRGTHMPGGPRTFFACASDSDRTVFVAGGHDDEKNALRSALAYDVGADKWVPLPDMAAERDECKAVFRRGRFVVVGGYRTEMQGRFERSAEAFDAATWKWDIVDDDFLDCATCPRTFVDGGDGDERVFMCSGGELMAMQGDTWQKLAKVPDEIRNVAYVGAFDGVVLLIGSSSFGESHMGFVFHVKSCNWRKLDTPEWFRGHVQTGCILEI